MPYWDFHQWQKSHHVEDYDNFSRCVWAANKLPTCHSLYLAPWINGNTSSFWNVNKVAFFLLVRYLENKQNTTWLLGDMEFLFSCATQYLTRLLPCLRYRVEHSKRNSTSPFAQVFSSIHWMSCTLEYLEIRAKFCFKLSHKRLYDVCADDNRGWESQSER